MSAEPPDRPKRVTLSIAEIVAAYRTHRAIDVVLAKQGLSAFQVALLASFAAAPAPIGAVTERLGITAPVATGGIDRLEERGLVRRTRRPTLASSSDRRTVLIEVTAQGRALLETLAELEVEL